MVDRLFWRAGFGPSVSDRQAWTGKKVSALIDHFLTTPYALAPTSLPATYDGVPINPYASPTQLQMEWLDRMNRTTNPFTERMTLFWHNHFPVSADLDNMKTVWLLGYRDRLRRYSDFAANPTAAFHDLAVEMTTADPAMSIYLDLTDSGKNGPNENYAREFMELFTLGPTNATGAPNYTQADVHQLARAFTGWSINYATLGVSFNPWYFDSGVKTILGRTGAFDAPTAVGIVLSQPNHGPFLIGKLWNEFIAAPIPSDALARLVSTYVANGTQLAPVLRGILSHPLMFDSLDQPTMVKPPIVFAIGVLRALGAPVRDKVQTDPLGNMTQQPYYPPNVAGWDGGLAWMTSTTAVARFQLVAGSLPLVPTLPDLPGETPQQVLERAQSICGSPWLSSGTKAILLAYAQQAPTGTTLQRLQRLYGLCELILGGPDAQVM
jgi:uncharacterized protein (DUF1800 family)